MNTDKIFAESIANEYAPKDTSKVMALRKLDARHIPMPSTIFMGRSNPPSFTYSGVYDTI